MSNIPLKIIELVRDAGLPENSARIYATVLMMGGGYPSRIAEEAQINRSTTYKILTDLAIKGLVSEIRKRGKLYYHAEKPTRLLNFTKRQITLAKEHYDQATRALPDLEGIFSLSPTKPKVRYFEKVEGVIDVYRDHIEQEKAYEMLGVSNTGRLVEFLPASFAREYVEKKEKLGVTTRGIFPDTKESRGYRKKMYNGSSDKVKPKMRFTSQQLFLAEGEVTIYGKNRISFINFQTDGMMGVIIEDDTISNLMKTMFELAWRSVKP